MPKTINANGSRRTAWHIYTRHASHTGIGCIYNQHPIILDQCAECNLLKFVQNHILAKQWTQALTKLWWNSLYMANVFFRYMNYLPQTRKVPLSLPAVRNSGVILANRSVIEGYG